MATGALLLALAPLAVTWIAAVVLATVVLRTRSPGRHGRRRAAAALAVVGCWLLVQTAVGGYAVGHHVGHQGSPKADRQTSRGSDRPATGPSSGGDPTDDDAIEDRLGDVSVDRVRTGDCLSAEPPDDPVTFPVVSCAQPHRAEVFAVFNLGIARRAKPREVDRLADGGCVRRFGEFVGKRYGDSRLEMVYFTPAGQVRPEDRNVICLLEPPSGTLTGSMRGRRE
jgi:hypothetical protein